MDEHEGITIIATGPLTSDALCAGDRTPQRQRASLLLRFHQPHRRSRFHRHGAVYLAARYDKGTADYINCPFTREEYDRFYDALVAAESVEARDWEKLNYFEGCLPIEELARRGRDTLRFGPMKPVGLRDPRTGKQPHAVVQLRQENLRADSYNLVGFQNHLKFGEQQRVFRMIPGLENARFLRYGQIHRNTYINAPSLLTATLQMKAHPQRFVRGADLRGRGLHRIHRLRIDGGRPCRRPRHWQRTGAAAARVSLRLAGALHHERRPKNFQPANITFDLLPPLDERVRDRAQRHRLQCERALREFDGWLAAISPTNPQ